MKVAVQFFGHLRTFETTHKSLKENLFDLYDCDVFMHTWSETEHKTLTWHKDKVPAIAVDSKLQEKLKKYYQLKALEVEEQKLEQDDVTMNSTLNNGSMSLRGFRYLLKTQQRVNEMREEYQRKNNQNYDAVLMIRPDIMLYDKLYLKTYLEEFKIVNGDCSHARFVSFNPSGIAKSSFMCATDILYFGVSEVISRLTSSFNDISDEFLLKNYSNPEGVLYKISKLINIETIPVNYKCNGENCAIIRSAENAESLALMSSQDRGKFLIKNKTTTLIPRFLKLIVFKKKTRLSNSEYLLKQVFIVVLLFKIKLWEIEEDADYKKVKLFFITVFLR